MNTLVSSGLWKTIKGLAKKKSRKQAAVAYVSSDDILGFGKGDLLVTDASDAAIKSGQTSAAVLARAHKQGAEIHSCPGLHAKVIVIDATAILGSANISNSSASSLIEAAWITDNPIAAGMASRFIHDLAEHSRLVDRAFLARTRRLPVSRRKIGSHRSPQTRIRKTEPRCWIIGLCELKQDFKDEEDSITQGLEDAERYRLSKDSDLEWVRFNGNSKFRTEANRGDTVIQIWSEDCSSSGADFVYRGAPIAHRQDERRCTRFYIEEPSDSDDTTITWSKFKKLAEKVGLSRVKSTSKREITKDQALILHTIWGK